MYRCVSRACDENIDYNLSSHQDIILHGREKEFAFRPRILLSCGHSVCEICIFTAVTSKNEEFIRCDDCGKTTSFSSQTVQTIKVNRPQTKPSVRWNEDCENDLLYEAFSIGAAFNSGRISISATPCVDLDESILETSNLPSHSYRNEAEVIAIRDKISNASASFQSAVSDGISMYSSCGKSLKFLFETKTALNKQFVSTKEAIRKRFHILHGLLQLEEANLIRELVKSKETTLKSLRAKEDAISHCRNFLKSVIMRSPQYAHIPANNPVKNEIESCRGKPHRIDIPPELPNHLASLNKSHDDLHQGIKKLVDFRKAVRFDVNVAFTSLIPSNQPTPNIPTTFEPQTSTRKKSKSKPLFYIPYIKQQLVTIHDVKDSGYFSAHLPSDESVFNSLTKALIKWCNLYRHSPCTSKIKPESDVVVWHDQKLCWARAKLKRIIEDVQSQKENYCFLNTNLTSSKVEVSLVDYADEVYETPIENVRESCSQLTDPLTYPTLLKVWKCRLKNILPLHSNMRNAILKFCASGIKVRLLILSEPIDGIYEVDIAHDIRDLVNPQPTLIEYLIFSNFAKLKGKDDSKDSKEYPQYSTNIDIVLKYSDAPFLKRGLVHAVDVTSIRTPHWFYVVIAKERDEIESIEKKINELYASPKMSISLRLYYPRTWVPCAARCELFWDKKKKRGKIFHRGYIIPKNPNVPPSHVEFFAVDYGESVVVPLTELRIIPDCYVSALPRQSIECSLDGIVPAESRNWSQNAITAFTEFFEATDTPTTITVKNRTDANEKRHSVVLTLHKTKANHPDGNINDILIHDGFAIKKTEQANCVDLSRDENPVANNNHRANNNRNDFKCYSLLLDMVRKSKENKLGTIDSLVPVKVTAFNSPESFYVQINTPEAQMEINNYMKRLSEEYDVNMCGEAVGPMQGFEPGEQCIYLYRSEAGFSTCFRRGFIVEFLGRGMKQRNNGNGSTDPRQLKQVDADSYYKIRDRDYGLTVVSKRKDMLVLQPSSSHRNVGEKCIQVHIPGIKHAGDDWSVEAVEFCERNIRKNYSRLFLKIEDDLTPTQPEKLSVDLIYLSIEIPDACLPSEEHYYSLRFQLLESGNALITSENLHFEKEIKADADSVYANIKIPHSIRDESLLSSLRSSFYTENQPIEIIKYMDANKPTTREFDAICTHVDDGPSIWFTIREEETHESSIGTINRKILQTIMKQEKLAPFKGAAEMGRACTVYSESQWYRGEIKANTGNKITILHVDTGFSQDYFIDKISSEVFCDGIPKLALVGRLDRCEPYVERRADAPARLKSYLTQHLIGKKIKVKWENFNSSREMLISVIFEDRGRDLKSILLNIDLVRESSSGLEDLPQDVRTAMQLMENSEFNFPNHQFSLEKFYPVIIADIIVENYLYVQLVDFDKVNSLEDEEINASYERYKADTEIINSNISSYSYAIEFNVGNSCCAKWNGEWFRGIVSEVIIPKIKYQVFFVDWGNKDIVELTNMRILPDTLSLRGNPIYGFFVRLSYIKPPRKQSWNQRLYDTMKSTVDQAASRSPNFLVKFKSTSVPFDVELWTADTNQQPVELFFTDLVNEGRLEMC